MRVEETSLVKALGQEIGFERPKTTDMFVRAALWGGLASGKTTTAILMASGLGERIAVIDTLKQVRYFKDLPDFSLVEVSECSPQHLIELIKMAEGFDVLVLDTASSEWVGPGSILEIVETMPPSKDKVSPWRVASPLHNQFMETVLSFPGHVILTYQAKHEFILQDNRVLRLALSPVWRDGTEYLFNFVGFLRRECDSVILTVEKSLFHKSLCKSYVNPGKELGLELKRLCQQTD